MKRNLIGNFVFFLSIIIAYSPSSATLLPFPSSLPSVSYNYDTILLKTWEGIKKRLIDPYNIPLVHRPRSE
ncbi:MAG: hypothetical protein N2053_06875, partial [Chitinispirillaceae bacterium]|nr:hypothetical protein [Chitinispirillaceae bacterium]